jgi:hypothetical protein
MKLALLGVAAMAVALSVGGTASASPASGAFSCNVKKFKVAGKPAVTACGPATAELKVAGTSYSFKNGLCRMGGTGSQRRLVLQLGTAVNDPTTRNNHGYPYLSIEIISFPGNAFITAMYHGKLISGVPGPVASRFDGTYAGTFASHVNLHYTGSWNCHGVSAQL